MSAFEAAAPLIVGCMNFGKRTPEPEARRIVARALELGLTHFDTANAYVDGESERIVGRALAGIRSKVSIASKVGFGRVAGVPEGLSRPRILAACHESLERLGTAYLDLYYLHVPDHHTPLAESVDAIATLLERGLIQAWGVSNYASWQILELTQLARERGIPGPKVSQQLYNVILRQLDLEYFKYTRAHPINTVAYNPLAGGLLSGKYTSASAPPPPGSRFHKNRLYTGRYWSEPMFQRAKDAEALAARHGLTLLELSYAFVASAPGVQGVLLGPGSVDHLEAAVAACAKSLPETVRAELDALHVAWSGTDTTYAR